jgi:hypothetical protein
VTAFPLTLVSLSNYFTPYSGTVRLIFLALALFLTACGPPPPPPVEKPKPDPVTEEWYGKAVGELTAINRTAENAFEQGKIDDAGALVAKGQELQQRLLAAPKPSLEAMQAASDLDDLYARILIRNHNVGWARLVYQKNIVRWANWKPATPDTERRAKQARAGIIECDRLLR